MLTLLVQIYAARERQAAGGQGGIVSRAGVRDNNMKGLSSFCYKRAEVQLTWGVRRVVMTS